MKRIVIVLVMTALAGCIPARAPQSMKAPVMVDTKPPRCFTARKCEAMWADAADAISVASGMRVRIATDSRIETFVANGYGRLTGTVKKVPEGDAGYVLRVQFECYRNTECWDRMASATNLFNVYFGPPEAPPSASSNP